MSQPYSVAVTWPSAELSGDTFTDTFVTTVTPVPEPTSILGTLAFGAGVALKRKQKLSKSTKKETAKVS